MSLFSIEGTNDTSGDDIDALRAKIMEVLRNEPYMGEKIPVRYLIDCFDLQGLFYLMVLTSARFHMIAATAEKKKSSVIAAIIAIIWKPLSSDRCDNDR